MPKNIAGTSKIQLPVTKAVGAQHQPPGVGTTAPPQVAVPSPSAALAINGKIVVIDVRSMSADDVLRTINTVPGVNASIDPTGRMVLTGVNSLEGDGDLRTILGI